MTMVEFQLEVMASLVVTEMFHADLDNGDNHDALDDGNDDAGHSHDDADDDGRVPVQSRVKLGGSEDDASSVSLPSHSTKMQKGSS